MYLSLHCHHQNDLHYDGHAAMSHNFCRERRAEADSNRSPSAFQPNALITARPNLLTNMVVGEEGDYLPIATLSPLE